MRTGIALGSNLGDRLKNLQEAAGRLKTLSSGPFLVSQAYETVPVNCPPDSPLFLNAAAEIEFEGDILDLLTQLQEFEQENGRPANRPKNAPRSIDLDILYCDNKTLSSARLVLPHPEMANRLFVLKPLLEICPNRVLPHQSLSIRELAEKLDSENNTFKTYNLL